MYIKRALEPLSEYTKPGKVLILYGPRRVGKTTLLNKLTEELPGLKFRFETGDDIELRAYLEDMSISNLKKFVEGLGLLIIDEAQNIPNIGQILKIIIDFSPNLRIVVSGSASFELANQVGEPLTGRQNTLNIYPISELELSNMFSRYELEKQLNDRLIFGSYPEVITADTYAEKAKYLDNLISSYLFKDILSFDRVKSSKFIFDLVRLIAFQVGSEVSHNELANRLGVDSKTIARYLELLEKTFIIYRLNGYSGNLRSEITKKSKYYFYDVGVRNAIISNYNDIDKRDDIGALWENFCIIERIKRNSYLEHYANSYFWRLYSGSEISYIEESQGSLNGYECKYSSKTRLKVPIKWREKYPEAHLNLVNTSNYLDFVIDKLDLP